MVNKKPFTRIEQISCLYYDRTKGEGCGHVNRFSVFLLCLLFLSLYVFACMFCCIFFIILDSRLANVWKK